MKNLTVKNTSSKATWSQVIVEVPESIEEAKRVYGSAIDNGFQRFMLHSLPIKLRGCKSKDKVQEFTDKLFTEPVNSRLLPSAKVQLMDELADFGFERKELKGLAYEGLEKLLKALRKVPITSPPEK